MIDKTPYYLFLDDTRKTYEAFFRKKSSYQITGWVVVRSVEEAVRVIKTKGLPQFISFDYDLDVGNSLPLVEFLKGQTLPPGFDYDIHSANRQGYLLIKEMMEQMLEREFVPSYLDQE